MFADEKQIHFGEINKDREIPAKTVGQRLEAGVNKKHTYLLKTQTEGSRIISTDSNIFGIEQGQGSEPIFFLLCQSSPLYHPRSWSRAVRINDNTKYVPKPLLGPRKYFKPPVFSRTYSVLLGSVVSALITRVDTVICKHNY